MTKLNLKPLVDLGLTGLEAEAYAYLLENSPATGYRVAKGLGKPAANVYKALDSLHEKGALVIEDSRARLCRAIPAEELLDSLERRFNRLRGAAELELSKLGDSPEDHGVYQLSAPEQVIARGRAALERCEKIALLDLFPLGVELLSEAITAAAERGVQVTVKVYETCEVPGAKVVLAAEREHITGVWTGHWINGVFDGEEHLLAYLSADGDRVIQAIWSGSPFLSLIYYNGFLHELIMSELTQGHEETFTAEDIQKAFRSYSDLLPSAPSGMVKRRWTDKRDNTDEGR